MIQIRGPAGAVGLEYAVACVSRAGTAEVGFGILLGTVER